MSIIVLLAGFLILLLLAEFSVAYIGIRKSIKGAYTLLLVTGAQIYWPLLLLFAYHILAKLIPDTARSEAPMPGTPREWVAAIVFLSSEGLLAIASIALSSGVLLKLRKT